MKILKLLLIFSIMISCNDQNKENQAKKSVNPIRDQIDFNKLDQFASKTPIGSNNYRYEYKDTLKDGTQVKIEGSKSENGFIEREILPLPSFLTIYKEFFPTGYIKEKDTLFGEYVKVGISEYYDEEGNKQVTNEDAKFGKIKYKDILNFLSQKNLVNLKTGKGWYSDDGSPAIDINFNEESFIWSLRSKKGKIGYSKNSPTGQALISDFYYEIDGNTGKVIKQFDK